MKPSFPVPAGLSLSRKLFFGGVAAGCSGAARFVALLFLARHLGPARFGELAWYLWVAELAAVIVTAGWGQAVTRYVAEYRAGGRGAEAANLAGLLIRRALLCSLLGLPLFGLLLAWSSRWGGTALWAAALYLAGVGGAFAPAWLQGNQAFGRNAALSVASGLLVLFCTWIGARCAGVGGALAGFLVAAVPGLAVAVMLVVRAGSRPLEEEEKSRVWRFTAATWGAAAVSAVVWMRTEMIFLERLVDAEAVGLYASALVFATALTQVVLLFRGVFLPHFSAMAGSGRTGELASAYGDSTLLFAAVLFPACFFGAALAPVVSGLFGDSFAGAWPLFSFLAIGGVVHIFAAGGALASSLERNTFVFWSACGGAAGFVILCLTLIPWWGLWGAATARVCGQWGMGLAGAVYLTRRAGIRLPVGKLVFVAAAAAAGAWVCLLLVTREGMAGGPWIGSAAGGIVYAGLLFLHPWVRKKVTG